MGGLIEMLPDPLGIGDMLGITGDGGLFSPAQGTQPTFGKGPGAGPPNQQPPTPQDPFAALGGTSPVGGGVGGAFNDVSYTDYKKPKNRI